MPKASKAHPLVVLPDPTQVVVPVRRLSTRVAVVTTVVVVVHEPRHLEARRVLMNRTVRVGERLARCRDKWTLEEVVPEGRRRRAVTVRSFVVIVGVVHKAETERCIRTDVVIGCVAKVRV